MVSACVVGIRIRALLVGVAVGLGAGGCWRDVGPNCVERCSHLQDSRECYRDCHYWRANEPHCHGERPEDKVEPFVP